MDWSSVLDELIRAEKKSDEGKAVAVVLDKLTALTKNHCARVVVEFVVRDKRKAGALVKKLREHTNKEVQKKAIQVLPQHSSAFLLLPTFRLEVAGCLVLVVCLSPCFCVVFSLRRQTGERGRNGQRLAESLPPLIHLFPSQPPFPGS
eukprot:2285686-Rhodomonas_salina.1